MNNIPSFDILHGKVPSPKLAAVVIGPANAHTISSSCRPMYSLWACVITWRISWPHICPRSPLSMHIFLSQVRRTPTNWDWGRMSIGSYVREYRKHNLRNISQSLYTASRTKHLDIYSPTTSLLLLHSSHRSAGRHFAIAVVSVFPDIFPNNQRQWPWPLAVADSQSVHPWGQKAVRIP